MLLVHINPMLDFREHFHQFTKDVKKLAKALAKRKLSPPLRTLAIEQLLKSKYYATHLGVFNERQLTSIDRILNKAMRQAIGLLPNLPSEEVQRPLKEAGLGLFPMRDKATQMGIEHLTRVMNKDTKRDSRPMLMCTAYYPNSTNGHTMHLSLTPLSFPHSAYSGLLAPYPGWNSTAYHISSKKTISPLASENHQKRSTARAMKGVPHYKDN